MRLIAVFTLLIPLAGPALAADVSADLAGIAGVYKHRFQNGTVQGEEYESENILEIAPTGSNLAYFRTHLEYFNGHSCDLWGMAEWRDNTLFYQEEETEGYSACRLQLQVKDGDILFMDDPEAPCRDNYCGSRGGFNGVEFKAGQKRQIRYMERLLRSEEFIAAKEAYDSRKP